jgi:hypothetical protein
VALLLQSNFSEWAAAALVELLSFAERDMVDLSAAVQLHMSRESVEGASASANTSTSVTAAAALAEEDVYAPVLAAVMRERYSCV